MCGGGDRGQCGCLADDWGAILMEGNSIHLGENPLRSHARQKPGGQHKRSRKRQETVSRGKRAAVYWRRCLETHMDHKRFICL